MKISIVVATYNRCENVRIFLRNLKNLFLPDSLECEVLIMDNNSTDATKQITAEYAISKNPVIRYISEQKQGKSYALNTGIREAKGDILAFTDDDCVPDPYWIKAISREFIQDPSLSILGGRIEPYNSDAIVTSLSLSKKRKNISHAEEVCWPTIIMGGNMAIRKIVIDTTTQFDTLLGPGTKCAAAEDIDMLYRLFKKGLKMVYSPDVLVFHNQVRSNDQAEADAVSREYCLGRGAFYCKHILQVDMSIFKIACKQLYSLSKTLSKGLIAGINFPYHKIALPSLFVGAYYYYKDKFSRN